MARAPTPLPPVFRSDDEEAELAVGELGASVETLCSSNQSMLTKLAKTRNDSIFSSHAGDGAADRLLPAPTVGTADRTSTSSSLMPLKIRCVTKKKKTEEHSLAAHGTSQTPGAAIAASKQRGPASPFCWSMEINVVRRTDRSRRPSEASSKVFARLRAIRVSIRYDECEWGGPGKKE